MSKKKEEKNKKKIIIPIIIGVVVLLVAIIGIVFYIKLLSVPKTTGTSWGDEYKDFILNEKDKIKSNSSIIRPDINKVDAYFIEPKDIDQPYMILEGQGKDYSSDKECDYKYIIGSNENIKTGIIYNIGNLAEKTPNRYTTEFLYLYDKEKNEADWYEVKKSYENDKIDRIEIMKLTDKIKYLAKEAKSTIDMQKKYGEKYYEEEEYKTIRNTLYEEENKSVISFNGTQLVENEFGVSEYSKRFIDITEEMKINEFKFEFESSDKNIVNSLKGGVETYQKDIVNFDKTAEKIIEKQNKIIEEAIKKQEEKEAEEKKKAEEEAAKKAAEEAAKGLKLDGTTIKYGTYHGQDAVEGDTIVINQGGTCTYNGKPCTYTISRKDFAQDISSAGSYHDCIQISGGSCYMPSRSGNALSDGDIQYFEFVY